MSKKGTCLLAFFVLLIVRAEPGHAWWSVPYYYAGGQSTHLKIASTAVSLLDETLFPDIAKYRYLNPDFGKGLIPWMSGATDDANAHGKKYEMDFGVIAADYDGGPIYRWLGIDTPQFEYPNDGVLPQYKLFNFANGDYSAYYYLALMAHLISDQAVPAHAANIKHISPMMDMIFPLFYGDNLENAASGANPEPCMACHGTPPMKCISTDTITDFYDSPAEGMIFKTRRALPTWNDSQGNPYWMASSSYIGAAFDDSWGRYGTLKVGGNPSNPLDYVDSFKADDDPQNIVKSQIETSIHYIAGVLAAVSKILPPLVRDFEISSESQSSPLIDVVNGTSVEFLVMENRDLAVSVTIKAVSKSAPFKEYVVRKPFMWVLDTGMDLPYEGLYRINAWKGECDDGTFLPDGKYTMKIEVEDFDKNEVNAVFPDLNVDSLSRNNTAHDFEISTPRPGTPTALKADTGNASVRLSWARPSANSDGSTMTDLQGYELYYSTRRPNDPDARMAGPINPSGGDRETFELKPLINDMTYFIAVKARDKAGNLSEFSEWVSSRPLDAIWVHYPEKISDALALARSGDRVMVGPGTYREPTLIMGRSTIFWEPSNVVLQSELGPDKTIITGGQDNSMSVMVGDKCKVIGFTIENSTGRGIDCVFAEDVLIANNIFIANAIGVNVSGLQRQLGKSVRIYNNVFVGNVRAVNGNMNYSLLDLKNNIFRGIRGDETGLYLEYCSSVVLTYNNFYGNGSDIEYWEDKPFVGHSTNCSPEFVDFDSSHPEAGDYKLNPLDTCAVDQGSPTFTSDAVVWEDCDGSVADLGAYGGPFAVVDNNGNDIPDCEEPVGRPVAVAVLMGSVDQPVTLSAVNLKQADLTFAIVTSPAHGTLSGTPPDLFYTAARDYSGDDEAAFTVANQHGASRPSPVKIRVKGSNAPPKALSQTVIVEPGQMGVVTLQGSDEDGDSLTYALDSVPSSGTLVLFQPPEFYFLPWASTRGPVNFTFHANDGFVNSTPASATLIINAFPGISLLTPDAEALASKESAFIINWLDTDYDSNAAISLFRDMDGDGFDGELIVAAISEDDPLNAFHWDTGALPDGDYYVYAVIQDEYSTGRAYAPGTLTIDRTAPVVSSEPESGTYREPIQVALLPSEPATIRFTTDGTEPTLYSPLYLAKITVSDSMTLRWIAVDAAGNEGRQGSASYVLDNVPPTLSIVPLPNPWRLGTISITGSMEAGATVTLAADRQVKIGMVTYPTASTWACTVADLLDGPVSFTATAQDAVGNTALVTGSTSILLNLPPSLSPIGDLSVYEGRQLSFTVAASDPDRTIPVVSAAPVPAGALFDGTIFSWKPSYEDAGTYGVTFTADDGRLMCSETISITVLDMNRAPTVPTMVSPRVQVEVPMSRPSLDLEMSTDPDGDALFYEYEIYSDEGLSEYLFGSGLVSGAGAGVSWAVPADLADNAWCWWRARSGDGRSLSQWTEGAGFFVNLSNDAPGPFSISEPIENAEVTSLRPRLGVTNSRDKDGDELTYSFRVYADAAMSQLVAAIADVPAGEGGSTTWCIDSDLMGNTWYHWRSVAIDEHGAATETPAAAFYVNLANKAPSLPAVQYPLGGEEIEDLNATIAVVNATDADSDALWYNFELDSLPTFDGPWRLRSALVPEGIGTTRWAPQGLIDNTQYFWRVKATDGQAESGWMTSAFFTNVANAAPTTVVVRNPGAGAWVDSVTPRLEIYPTSDPNRDRLCYTYQIYPEASTEPVAEGQTADAGWVSNQTLLKDTWYVWRVRAVDEHGLEGEWSELTPFFVNDNGIDDPPSITVTEPSAGHLTSKASFTISWVDGDPDSEADIALYRDSDSGADDGVLIADGIKEDPDGEGDRYEWDMSGVPPGTWWIYAVIFDAADTRVSYGLGSVTLDSQAPTTRLSPEPGTYIGPITVTMTAADTRDPSPTIFFTADGSVPSTQTTRYTRPVTITRTTEFRYFAVDDAGAQEAPQGPAVYDVVPTYTIIAEAGPGGTISPSGSVTVQLHADQTFTVTPNANHRIATLTVDGQALSPPESSYRFKDVSRDHSINATYSPLNEVTVVEPNGGEVLATGSTATIRYGGPASIANYLLEYTTDNGKSYTAIAAGVAGYTYRWPVPPLTANAAQCKVRATGLSTKGSILGSDVSDENFAIEVVRLIKPNGGETINSGKTIPLVWITRATSAPVTGVNLSYSTTGGGSWTPIVTLKSNPGTYTWAVPATIASVNCRVRVQLFNVKTALGSDASDHAFTIAR